MKAVHKLTVLVVDLDDLGAEEVRGILEHQKYPNWCIYPEVLAIETRQVEWSDDHPLNSSLTRDAAVAELFAANEKDAAK